MSYSNQDGRTRGQTPGYKAVLVTDDAFRYLKSLQSWRTSEHLRVPVRFDLKDIVTALVEEASEIPEFQERVLRRALMNVSAMLVANDAVAPPVVSTLNRFNHQKE